MTEDPCLRAFLAKEALKYEPPLIRESLINLREFREEFGLSADATIMLGEAGISILRSELFEGIRSALAGQLEVLVTDTNQRDWKILWEETQKEQPSLLLTYKEYRCKLPGFSLLSPDKCMRLRSLDQLASDVNLPTCAKNTWEDVLSERELNDEEVDRLLNDIRDTPVSVARSIHAEIQKGQSNISSLVPTSRRYFERLIGEYDGSGSIGDYAAGIGKKFLRALSVWRPYGGFLQSVFLSSHSTLTAEISIERLKSDEVLQVFEFLEKCGDRISQLGAIEIGLRVLPGAPEIEPFLVQIVKHIRDDDVEAPNSEFKLLSALFTLVDGQISRRQILPDVPPFYRRLASLSHAALIHRQAAGLGIDAESFYGWALSNRGEQFLYQSLADMRSEPRWSPDFSVASQIKADFFGRLIIAAKGYESHISDSELRSLLLGDEPGSLDASSEFPRPFFPGPLEGNEASANELPGELANAVESPLEDEQVGPSSFVALVNSALIFRVDSRQVELAAQALRLGKHRLENIEDRSHLLAALHGLATVCAVSRGQPLADELRVLVRRYRRDPEYSLSIEEALRICLVAAASRADLNEWRDFVGDWLTELAFEDFQGNEGEWLYSALQCLCHAVPELWISCGRADAALRAFLGR